MVFLSINAGTSKLYIGSLILAHPCMLEASTVISDKPYYYSSSFGPLISNGESSNTQRISFNDTILYGPNGDWSRILLLGVLGASPFQEGESTAFAHIQR